MKLKQFQDCLKEENIDAALLYSVGMETDPNFFYFTQYSGVGCLLVARNSDAVLLVPEMEMERAVKQSLVKDVRALEKKRLFECAAAHLGSVGVVGIDKSAFTLIAHKGFKKFFKGVKTADICACCQKLRVSKTSEEMALIEQSCSYADKVFEKMVNEFSGFKTESDVAGFLQYEAFRRGMDVSFKPIVASGKKGSMAHCEPQQVALNEGLCVIDFAVKYKGYCSDMTRTIGIGSVSSEEKKKYSMLLDVQENSLNMIKDKMKCSKIYDFVVDALGEDSQYFTHGLGHGIGVEIHELPDLKGLSKDRLVVNSPFTVEPGVYYPGKFGIRIEDSVVLKDKLAQLTTTSKDLMVL